VGFLPIVLAYYRKETKPILAYVSRLPLKERKALSRQLFEGSPLKYYILKKFNYTIHKGKVAAVLSLLKASSIKRIKCSSA